MLDRFFSFIQHNVGKFLYVLKRKSVSFFETEINGLNYVLNKSYRYNMFIFSFFFCYTER